MVVANLGTLSGRSLPFGALLTKIFKAYHVSLVSEADMKITSPISEYTLTRAGGAENLLGSINVGTAPIVNILKTPMTMPCHQINNPNTGLIIWLWNKNDTISAYNENNKWLISSMH
ncbi:hypothetical protein ACSBR1_003503 [Camellia fascicularis]